MISETLVHQLRRTLRGQLLGPRDAGYEEARRVHNAMIDRHPALIARCAGAADVQAAVDFARQHGLLVSVRGGGHNVTGNAVCDDGLMIDLRLMRGISLNPAARTVRAEAGLTWGEVNDALQEHGFAATGGFVSVTGVAGLTLGGGFGWLLRKHGLAIDNLLSVDIVTADGSLLTASGSENRDLFWGLRGGGGNFGVVTTFEFAIHPAGTVLAGQVAHPLAAADGPFNHWVRSSATVSDAFTSGVLFFHLPDDPSLPPQARGAAVVGIGGVYTGPIEKGEQELRDLRAQGTPMLDLFQPMPYNEAQKMADALWPSGLQNYWKSGFLKELPPAAVDTMIEAYRTVPSPHTVIVVEHLGGAMRRVGEMDTAFGNRQSDFNLLVTSAWRDPSEAEANIRWTRNFWSAMRPWLSDSVYVNYLGTEGPDRVAAAYGAGNYARLVALKNQYDPANLFRLNQNIEPAPLAGA